MIGIEHLYLHVPFCLRRCPYCDYAVTAGQAPDVDSWVAALRSEAELRRRNGVSLECLRTILVGGGTPSLLGRGVMAEVRSIVGEGPLRRIEEWTAEANPEHVDASLLEAWSAAGVTRVNVGVQSLRGSALEWLGRTHDPEQALRAMEAVARAGLPSWGVDLLFGLPEAIDPDPTESVGAAIAAGAPHVSLYELVAEEGTPLGDRVASGDVRLADDDVRADQFLTLRETLRSAGYEHYELSGFARPGHRCRHTMALLDGRSWLGLGPGAHSNIGGLRAWNLVDWRVYLMSVAEGRLPEAGTDRLGTEEERAERLRLRLRRAEGLPSVELGPCGRRTILRWVERGLAHGDADRVRLTPEGWLRLDELSLELARE